MADIRFETGLVDYDINGRATVRFNPTDSFFCRTAVPYL